MSSYFSFRLNRLRRLAGRQLSIGQAWTRNYINRHVYGAWQKLGLMRWQFAAWILIILISLVGIFQGWQRLDKLWLTSQPVSGGTYHEGVIGRVRLVNPLFVDNSATADVVQLVYSKLIRTTDGTTISPDLANQWEVSTDRRTYTLHLRPDIHWHDGVVMKATDVAFTFKLIQNPDTRSPLASSWDKVVVNAVDEHTIQFVLPASYSGFWTALSQVGIVPEHALAAIRPSQLRLDEFNQRPIGTGPFILDYLDVNSDKMSLRRYDQYHGGSPRLDGIDFLQFDDAASMVDAYAKRRLDGLSRLNPDQASDIRRYEQLSLKTYRLPSYVGAFFNTARPALADVAIRQALATAVDRKTLVQDVLKDEASVAHYPIPVGYTGFNPDAARQSYNRDAAKQTLQGKITEPLKLVTANSAEFPEVARRLADNWRAAGVQVDVITVDSYTLQQNYIRPRQYDILLYGEDIGADSDVYGFWHSSQAADPGLNVSAYKSPAADQFLEQARFGKDLAFRDGKYREFERIWAADVPALLLYSPYYLYAHTVDLSGLSSARIISPSDRFYGVQNWAIKSKVVPNKTGN